MKKYINPKIEYICFQDVLSTSFGLFGDLDDNRADDIF